MALYCHNCGMVSVALKLMYRVRYLALLIFGEGHPDMATFDVSMKLYYKTYKILRLRPRSGIIK